MLRRTIIALAAVTLFMSVTALAGPKTGCKKFNFIGTFLGAGGTDVFPAPSAVRHEFAFQLTIHSDGTVNQNWTGTPDYLINAGTGSPSIGSWTCRDDGKLVIVWLGASYVPITVDDDPINLTSQDVTLWRHSRTTYLFSVDDDNTLSRLQSRTRSYTPTQDPTDAVGGTLGSLVITPSPGTPVTYRRLVASDSDLVAVP